MNRRLFLVHIGVATAALVASACGASATSSSRSPIELTQDKPTLLYFFTDN